MTSRRSQVADVEVLDEQDDVGSVTGKLTTGAEVDRTPVRAVTGGGP